MTNRAINPGLSAQKVLIIKFGPISSFMLAMGAMRSIRDHHPSAQITLLTTPEFEAFAKACPYFDKLEIHGAVNAGPTNLARALKSEKFDIAYDLQRTSESADFCSSAKAKLSSGATNASDFQIEASVLRDAHELEQNQRQMGVSEVDTVYKYPDFEWIAPSLGRPPRLLPEYFGIKGRFAIILPLPEDPASDTGFPSERYIAIAQWMIANEIAPVVIGGREESPIANRIVRLGPLAKSLCTRTDFFQTLTLSQKALFVIGYDCDNMHLTNLAGAPGVALYDQTSRDPELFRPRGGNLVMLRADNHCDIAVDDVIQAIKALSVL